MRSTLGPDRRVRGGWLGEKGRHDGERVERGRDQRAGFRGGWLAAVALLLVPVAGKAATEEYTPRIHPGAIEVGVAGSLTSVEGANRADVTLRGGTFSSAGSGLAGIEAEVSYGHVASLDLIDLEGALSLLKPLGGTALYPFLATAGGIRQERLGSFRQVRYPVGFDAGIRALVGARAGVRLEYHYRRILRDPVGEYTEQRVIAGLSLFFHNPNTSPQPGMRLPRFPKIRKIR